MSAATGTNSWAFVALLFGERDHSRQCLLYINAFCTMAPASHGFLGLCSRLEISQADCFHTGKGEQSLHACKCESDSFDYLLKLSKMNAQSQGYTPTHTSYNHCNLVPTSLASRAAGTLPHEQTSKWQLLPIDRNCVGVPSRGSTGRSTQRLHLNEHSWRNSRDGLGAEGAQGLVARSGASRGPAI